MSHLYESAPPGIKSLEMLEFPEWDSEENTCADRLPADKQSPPCLQPLIPPTPPPACCRLPSQLTDLSSNIIHSTWTKKMQIGNDIQRNAGNIHDY
ncbi:hypothetical protein GDO81_011871 [Engystomops pustulosus]|uniref:Uncharacterized protein n=1 Tax=Engystomops pustulosus TaxID=76066 RepID=A0AAV7BH91_ENGPU|nr:hypothetical protein GDO81_011871 [Engystomops pustulosus]